MQVVTTMCVLNCIKVGCGILFAIPIDFSNNRRDDHATFYCPNGHQQFYPGESDVEKARRETRETQARLNQAEHARLVAVKEREKAIRDKRKVERRVAHGVCPCCTKTFADVANHMVTEHPAYRLPEGKVAKQITDGAQ